MSTNNSDKKGDAKKSSQQENLPKDFGMKEYSGEGPALDRAKVVDGGNFEEVSTSLVNEDSPLFIDNNFNDIDGSPDGDRE